VTTGTGERVSIEEGVVIARGGERDLRVDVYTPPPGTANSIGVLLVHGGSWRGGDRSQLRGYGILLGRVGYTSVACEYRLSGEAKWPAQLHDVKAAIRWFRSNSERLDVDASRIAVLGASAGGHLALMVAATADDARFEGDGVNAGAGAEIAACIAIYPPALLTGPADTEGAVGGLLGDHANDADYASARPLTYVRGDWPPTLLVHGNRDALVPVAESLEVHAELSAAGSPVELHVFDGQPHAFDAASDYGRLCASIFDVFLKRHLAPSA